MSQYSCNDECVAAQEGCFQYFTGVTGTIQSYNLAGGAQLTAMDYKNCIRQEAGYCCIEYSVISYAIGNGKVCDNDVANRCASASTCSIDWITVPNVQKPAPNTYDKLI